MKKFILLFILINSNLNVLIAQSKGSIKDECLIIINDSITVKGGDYILDNQQIIDFNRILIDKSNIKSIETIKNPCSKIHSGYKGAYVIYRKKVNPFFDLKAYVKKVKEENSDFNFYKTQVVINEKVIDNINGYQIEATDNLELTIVRDEIREYKLTILIGYDNDSE